MKVIKYGHGMTAKKWYKSECPYCHTVFKAHEFEVTFIDDEGDISLHPTPSYKVICPVCEKSAKYELKKHTLSLFQINTKTLFKLFDKSTLNWCCAVVLVSALLMELFALISDPITRLFLGALPLGIIVGVMLGVFIDINRK